MKAIWEKLGLSEPPKSRARYGALDHYLMKKPIHDWIYRRWGAFLIASQCVVALALSIPFAHALHVHMTWKWLFTVIGVMAVFVWPGRTAWREAYQMFELVAGFDYLTGDPKKEEAQLHKRFPTTSRVE